MVRIKVDLRYAFIATEGTVARRHAELAVRRLAGTAAEVQELVLSEYRHSDDEAERSAAFHEIGLLEDELPRLELYGVVFVLFAVFESVVKRLPENAWLPQAAPEASLRTKRGDFVSAAVRFYRDTLGVALFNNPREEEFMRMLSDIRSAVAHASGNVSMLNVKVERRLREQWIRKYDGLHITHGHLSISPALVLEAATTVEECLRGVIGRLKLAYPGSKRLAT
jgi:hypothetical protein